MGLVGLLYESGAATITLEVNEVCWRRTRELSPGGYRGALDVSHAPTSDSGPAVTEETDGCGYCLDPWCAAVNAAMPATLLLVC